MIFKITPVDQGDEVDVSVQAVNQFKVTFAEGIPGKSGTFTKYITPTGTTGNITTSTNSFRVNFASGSLSLIVTNPNIHPDSILVCQVASNDDAMDTVVTVKSEGSVMIIARTAPVTETAVDCILIS